MFGNFATYVMQDDVLFGYFTVKEALTFSARLRLKISEAAQDERINKLIDDLGLEKCKDHSCQHRRPLVGIETRHCGVHLHQPSLMSIASESESIGPIRSRV